MAFRGARATGGGSRPAIHHVGRRVGRKRARVQQRLSCGDPRTQGDPERHDPDHPVPRAHVGAEPDPALESLVQLPRGGPLPAERQGGVLRRPQRGRHLRLEPALQVPHHRAGRGGVPRRGARPRHPGLPARARPVHVLARRSRLRHRGRRHPPPERGRVPPDERRAQLRLLRRPDRAHGRPRSRRSATRSGRSPSRARARATCSSSSSRRWSTSRTSAWPPARSAARR